MSAFGGQQRIYNDQGGSRWVQADVDPVNHSAELMKEQTEREVANAAWVSDEDFKADPVGAGADEAESSDDNDELVDEMSEVEGWDGRKLPLEEIAERNLNGDRQDGWDRPLELADMEDAAEKMDVLQSQNAEQGRVIDSLLTGGAPSEIDQRWNQEMAGAHQRLENTGMYDPADRQRMIDNHLRNEIAHQERLAEARHGDEFSERYESLKRDAAVSAQHAQYLKSLLLNGQLGEGVMRYGPQRAAPTRQQPRQQPERRQQPQQQRSQWPQEEIEAADGVSTADQERFIADIWSE